MLLGLYPPGENINTLKDEQIERAVPPIEDFDFDPWTSQMGNAALPYQTTVFPIQMEGISYDYMLGMNDTKCSPLEKAHLSKKPELDAVVKEIVAGASDIPQSVKDEYMTPQVWEDFCHYVYWADVEGVELQDDILGTVSTCEQLSAAKSKLYAHIDADQQGVSTNDIRQNMQERLKQWENCYATGGVCTRDNGVLNIEPYHPFYSMMWMPLPQLELLAASLTDEVSMPFVPSSTILLEITEETDGLQVTLKINDQETVTSLCGDKSTCALSEF
jgi:hypothetical protein